MVAGGEGGLQTSSGVDGATPHGENKLQRGSVADTVVPQAVVVVKLVRLPY